MKLITNALLMVLGMISFSQCSSAQKFQESTPFKIGDVYFQKWVAGVEGGGSGVNLFIPTEESSIKLDSVYFRGKATKLESKTEDGLLYIGRFKSKFNKKQDIILSDEPYAEYGNTVPEIPKKIPFELMPTECVISYRVNDSMQYFKIENIIEKQMISYPSVPPNMQ